MQFYAALYRDIFRHDFPRPIELTICLWCLEQERSKVTCLRSQRPVAGIVQKRGDLDGAGIPPLQKERRSSNRIKAMGEYSIKLYGDSKDCCTSNGMFNTYRICPWRTGRVPAAQIGHCRRCAVRTTSDVESALKF